MQLDELFGFGGPLARLRRAMRTARIFVHDLIFPNNVLKIDALPRSWTDRDYRMFHAVFQILVDFVELEQPFRPWDAPSISRFVSVEEMRAWIEQHYNSAEAKAENYCEWFTDEDRASADQNLANTYQKYSEILGLYEWYKAKGYELDYEGLYEKTGEKHVLGDKGIEVVSTGKPKLITWTDVAKAEEAHMQFCDAQLERVIRIRRYLWT